MSMADQAGIAPVARETRRSGLMEYLRRQSRPRLLLLALALLILVAAVDYLVGFELYFSIFYLVPISLVTWFLGRRHGFMVSIGSVVCGLAGDMAAGAIYSSRFVPFWNAVITLAFYMAMVSALASLRALHQQLESKVRERTAALRSEMAERERLEKALLEVSEREQRRIGHDLHDSLCQHLLGAALAGQVLGGKLEAKSLAETEDAGRLVTMIEDGIDLARNLARGLAPVELSAEGLMAAFRELARTTTERFQTECRFAAPAPVLINDPVMAIHLFRIAQEAVSNALKHGHPKLVTIGLKQQQELIELTIRDDGSGLPDPLPATRGMGLHIMQHRASMIGATFEVERMPVGTLVVCRTLDDAKKEEI